MRRILHKLERLPPDQRKLVIDDIRPEDFSSQEYARIRAINGDRAKDYLHVSIAILTYIVHEYLLYILKYVWCLTEKVTIPHAFLDNKLKNVFVEKGFGQAPETDDPAVLSRELKRRTRFAMLGYWYMQRHK